MEGKSERRTFESIEDATRETKVLVFIAMLERKSRCVLGAQ